MAAAPKYVALGTSLKLAIPQGNLLTELSIWATHHPEKLIASKVLVLKYRAKNSKAINNCFWMTHYKDGLHIQCMTEWQ